MVVHPSNPHESAPLKTAKSWRIHQKIGFGYGVAIGLGFAGSMAGLVVADYFQGQSIYQLLDAQIQSQLLSDFEHTADDIELTAIYALTIPSQGNTSQHNISRLRTELDSIRQLEQAIAAFFAENPAWMAGKPDDVRQLLATYLQILTQQARIVDAVLATDQPDAVLPTLFLTSTAEARQLNDQLHDLIQIARRQELSAADAMEAAQGLEKFIIVFSMLLASAIAGLLAWRTTTDIARPIETVTHIAQRVALETNYSLQVPISSTDEIGILAASFNHLITQVATHIQALDTSAQASQEQAQHLAQTLEALQRTQLQLVQAEKMSSLGQLAAGMAHEINNPITFIHGNINYVQTYAQNLFDVIEHLLALFPDLPAEMETHLQDVELDFIRQDFPNVLMSLRHGVERINSLMLSLRVFSRLQEAQLKRADLHDGIESIVELLSHRLNAQARRPAIAIVRQFSHDLPLVECYSSQINQVFMNIIHNAIDAIDDRWAASPEHWQPTLTISTIYLSAKEVLVQISNNGLAIPEPIQGKLYDPFFTTKPVGKGVGLGLSICYDVVVEKHGGSLTCQSPWGETTYGAQFTIQLPVHHCLVSLSA